MVLVSIHPFPLRKIFLFVVASLCFSVLCLADPVLMVHRFAPTPDHFAGEKVTATISAEPLQPHDPSLAAPGFGPLGSIDSTGNQTELRFTEPGKIGLPPALPSSIFRKAMCELRSMNLQAGTTAWPSLPLAGDN
jgi:hypothetical protein